MRYSSVLYNIKGVGSTTMLIPVMTENEYNNIKAKADSGETLLVNGKNNSYTSYFPYYDNIFKFSSQYLLITHNPNVNRVWLEKISQYFRFKDITMEFLKIPASGVAESRDIRISDLTFRKEISCYITLDTPNIESALSVYYAYRMAARNSNSITPLVPTNGFLYSSSGIGAGSTDSEDNDFFEYSYRFAVVNNDNELIAISTVHMSGYYGFEQGSTTKGLYISIGSLIRSPQDLELMSRVLNISPPQPYTEPDPYTPGGTSEHGGHGGTFTPGGINVPIPDPGSAITRTGFVTLFNPTLVELQNLSSYMWSDLFDINTFKKLFANPMDCILGLHILPVPIPDGGSETVKVGGISTNVTMTKAAKQFITFDCGSIKLEEYWGSYLDYDPYTKVSIYLPYIGTKQLYTDEIMGKTIAIKYNINIFDGSCMAIITSDSTVLYQFGGNCATPIPVTSSNYTRILQAVVGLASSAVVGIGIGGTFASSAIAGGAASTAIVPSTPNIYPNEDNTISSGFSGGIYADTSKINASTVRDVLGSKTNIEHSGALGSSIGLLGVQYPFLIITRPSQCVPENQNQFTGYPSYITRTLSELSGYTEVYSIHLKNVDCTEVEKEEISKALYEGVIL